MHRTAIIIVTIILFFLSLRVLMLLFPTQFDVDLISTMLVSLRYLYISLFRGWGWGAGVYEKRSTFPSFAIAHFQNAGVFFSSRRRCFV